MNGEVSIKQAFVAAFQEQSEPTLEQAFEAGVRYGAVWRPEVVNYVVVHEYAMKHNLDYNQLCAMVRRAT